MKKTTIILSLLLSLACQKERVYITGFIFKDTRPLYTNYYQEVYVHNKNGFPIVPICKINGKSLNIDDYHYDYYLFKDYNRFDVNKTYEMTVEYQSGKAYCKVFMPGNFKILKPDTSYILKKDSVLQVIWNKANGATWYWLDLTIDYDYEDTLGEWDEFSFWKDTVVYDTFIIYEKNRFIPSYVDTILDGEGTINIWAMDGPVILPGALGNISGAGYGILRAANQPGERDFYVGTRSGEIVGKNRRDPKVNKKLYKLRAVNGGSLVTLPTSPRP